MKLSDVRVPDSRAFVALGLFGLGWRVIEMLAADPKLAANQLFAMLAQALIISGVLLVASYYFGSSKPTAKPAAPDAADPTPPQTGA